jgi:hypothetical protein
MMAETHLLLSQSGIAIPTKYNYHPARGVDIEVMQAQTAFQSQVPRAQGGSMDY